MPSSIVLQTQIIMTGPKKHNVFVGMYKVVNVCVQTQTEFRPKKTETGHKFLQFAVGRKLASKIYKE